MKLSLMTPTYQRHHLAEPLYQCFQAQTHYDRELLVLDDSPTPSPFFERLRDPRVKYVHTTTRLTVGAKRNALADMASGQVLGHFDDDDYYAPEYVSHMLEGLGRADFFKLSGWFAYSQVADFFGYWEASQLLDYQYKLAPGQPVLSVCTTHMTGAEKFDWVKATLWGYGFSYVYKRSVWEAVRFNPHVVGWNDYCFAQDLITQGFQAACDLDTTGLALHVIHDSNVSFAVPQFRLPAFLLTNYFGAAGVAYLEQCRQSDQELRTAQYATGRELCPVSVAATRHVGD